MTNMKNSQTAVLATILILLAQGCTTAPVQRGALETLDVSISTQKARLIVRTFADQFAGTIETTADRLASKTNDPSTRRYLLLWKLGGISEVFGASFQPDPYISFIDLAALAGQMRNFFQNGIGAESLGPLSSEAANACDAMWNLAKAISDSVRRDSQAQSHFKRLEDWVEEHPLDNWQFNREPIGPNIYLILGDNAMTLGETVATIQERIDDLSAQVTFINTKLLDRARWQAELLMLEAGSSIPLDSIRLLLHISTATLANLDAFLDSVPSIIKSERQAAMESVGQERILAFESLREELARLEAFVTAERSAAMNQVDNTAQTTVSRTVDELTTIIDMLTIRIALLCLGFCVLGAVIGVLIARRMGRAAFRA